MMMDRKTAHSILEVGEHACRDEINAAYRDLVQVWHPDRFQSADARLHTKASERLKTLNEARTFLLKFGEDPEEQVADIEVNSKAKFRGYAPEPFLAGHKYGYLDPLTRRIVIPPQYGQASEFKDGLAKVGIEEGFFGGEWRYGLIDKSGRPVTAPKYLKIDDFHEDLAVVEVSGNRFGYINRRGRIEIKAEFMRARPFSEGLAAVCKFVEWRWIWGYIDKRGRFAIKPNPDWAIAEPFRNGWARVLFNDSGWFRINRKGLMFQE